MSFLSEKTNDIAIETVEISRATFKEAEEFKNFLNTDIEEGYLKLIVDLTHCAFIDSTFLSTIVTALKKVSKKGGNLKLVGIHSETQALLELTGTVKIFEIFDTVDDAIVSFTKS
ncbi:MAG: STAS domain-containing protein [Ignavibacteriaceae bacterium]|nr:STAS domain-containing protein [Ignavibacteriaceae bacterium]